MKKNFYFQHSLMSMFDPRMKHLVDNEGLRGLGAYWIIIEKLSILPEPRAQLDYLRAYCDSKKITLCYLKKIILEYDLFELEEDGYFMPKELNPLHKKGEKTEKTTQEKPGFCFGFFDDGGGVCDVHERVVSFQKAVLSGRGGASSGMGQPR